VTIFLASYSKRQPSFSTIQASASSLASSGVAVTLSREIADAFFLNFETSLDMRFAAGAMPVLEN
jgi:hypothetical protein